MMTEQAPSPRLILARLHGGDLHKLGCDPRSDCARLAVLEAIELRNTDLNDDGVAVVGRAFQGGGRKMNEGRGWEMRDAKNKGEGHSLFVTEIVISSNETLRIQRSGQRL